MGPPHKGMRVTEGRNRFVPWAEGLHAPHFLGDEGCMDFLFRQAPTPGNFRIRSKSARVTLGKYAGIDRKHAFSHLVAFSAKKMHVQPSSPRKWGACNPSTQERPPRGSIAGPRELPESGRRPIESYPDTP